MIKHLAPVLLLVAAASVAMAQAENTDPAQPDVKVSDQGNIRVEDADAGLPPIVPVRDDMPAPQLGSQGPRGETGPRGERGPSGTTKVVHVDGNRGHKNVYGEIKEWNPVSRTFVELRDAKIKNGFKAHMIALENRIKASEKGAATGAPSPPNTARKAGESPMDFATALLVILGFAAFAAIAAAVYFGLRAATQGPRGMADPNRNPVAVFDPHQVAHSAFAADVTRERASIRVLPAQVLEAQAAAQAEIAHARAIEATARAHERRDALAALTAPRVINAPDNRMIILGGIPGAERDRPTAAPAQVDVHVHVHDDRTTATPKSGGRTKAGGGGT